MKLVIIADDGASVTVLDDLDEYGRPLYDERWHIDGGTAWALAHKIQRVVERLKAEQANRDEP